MMKTAHIFLPFMAALLLVPVASAQTPDHEKYSLNNGVATNKYVLNDVPNPDGTYTLRLETFITGEVSASAMPTDFVLVIDNSGSMYYDYLPYGTTSRPMKIPFSGAAANSNEALLLPYLVEGYGASDVSANNFQPYTGVTYNREYQLSTVGQSVGSSIKSYFYQCFYNEGDTYASSQNRSTRYYKYDDPSDPDNHGYYRIFHKMNGSYYNLAIKIGSTYKYLYGDSLHDTPNNTITSNDKIIYNGPIYHIKSRQEALLEGVDSFLGLIAAENAKPQWRDGVTKHQVSVVSFSVGYAGGSASITEYPSATPSDDTKVIKSFGEVDDADTWYGYVKDRMTFRGGQTCIDYGVNLAGMLLSDLETKDGGQYASLNAGGVNRKKVVIVFTDGEPYDQRTGQTRKYFQITYPCIQYGNTIKEVGLGKLNGRIYTIDLCMNNKTTDFLGHLSSNYPKAGCNKTDGDWSANQFTGKIIPWTQADTESEEEWRYLKDETEPFYYKNTQDGDLTSVFSGIASANTGQQAGEKLVVMDVMSDSFKIPSDASGSIKLYTAQCIGTKEIEGETYLAFAQEVEVGSRDPLAHFWVSRVEGEGDDAVTVWEDLGAETSGGWDIDTGITVVPADDGKSITVGGFDYVSYWCGLDDVIGHHNNTRQISTSDPNYSAQLDGYRGFKLIIEFPIVVSENAIGGPKVFTNNKRQSGLYSSVDGTSTTGSPIATYESPYLMIPVRLEVQKDGLKPGESASFIVERREIADGSEWLPYTSFILTGVSGTELPSIKMFTLDPSYYYRIVENGWNWNYSNPATSYPSTENENLVTNPIVITNNYQDLDIKHAEAKAVNTMGTGSTTVYDEN